MKLLVLGGTVFLGRHLVDAALVRGHEVTLFNRGQHNADLYPQVEKLRGDRDGGLGPLRGRSWDAVIDTSGYVPRLVREAAEALAESVGHYTFISSISAYADLSRPGVNEDSPLGTVEDETVEDASGANYGPLKALCERAAVSVLPGRTLVIRPGLIVGPYDPTDRFTYWPRRLDRGGEVLAPGRPDRPVQLIDARDLAEWNLSLAEQGTTGIFNATGPAAPLPMAELIDSCNQAAGSAAHAVWVDDDVVLEAGVTPWSGLPLWIPDSAPMGGFMRVDCSRAISAGLTFRPLLETARATLLWDRTRPESESSAPAAGISAEKERDVLARWRSRGAGAG